MKHTSENINNLSDRQKPRLAFEPVLCAVCSDTDYEMSDIKGYEHLCVACACGQLQEDLELQWEKELATYAERAGIKYDFNEFCQACWGDTPDVDKTKLKGLTELIEVYEMERCRYKEYTAPPEPQLELDFSGLPF